MDAHKIASRLKSLRGETPQKVVAEACNISVSALAMYESGKRIPRDETKVALARFYNSKVESIFFTA